jgi:hypothetical protein
VPRQPRHDRDRFVMLAASERVFRQIADSSRLHTCIIHNPCTT